MTTAHEPQLFGIERLIGPRLLSRDTSYDYFFYERCLELAIDKQRELVRSRSARAELTFS